MCDCHSSLDRRSLLRAGAVGAATVTVGSLATFEPAAAGQVRRKVFRGEFTSSNTPDWHYLPFRVPKGVTKLHVAYEYTPTDLGPISINVVDIGIFDPSGHGLGDADGFRGWSGGARRQFRITRSEATPGYIAGPITPGVWNIVLGPYLITPPGTPWKVVVSLHFGKKREKAQLAPAPTAVPGTGPGWYRGDLHTHTVHSDGRWKRKQLVTAARAAGLDFICSTEHNTSSASYTWGRHVPDDFLVITGEEVTTRTGHWLAVGLPPATWIDWRYRGGEGHLQTFTDRVREVGGLAIAAHPFNPVPSIRWGHGYDYAGIDAVEVWNGPWAADDQQAVEQWHDLLASGTFVPAVGNSDTHNEGQAVGLAQTAYRLQTLSTAEVVEAIRGGHAWIAESSAVDLTFEAVLGEATASCGDHLGAADDDLVTVRLAATGVPGTVAQVRGPASILAGGLADPAGAVSVEVEVPAGTAPFVRAEVRRPGGTEPNPLVDVPGAPMVALTNPIFLT
jgi:predicted metal-dependent phosphoesterase TrpH